MPVPLNLWDHGKKSMQKQGLRVEQQEEVTPEQWSVLWETTLGCRKVMSHEADMPLMGLPALKWRQQGLACSPCDVLSFPVTPAV